MPKLKSFSNIITYMEPISIQDYHIGQCLTVSNKLSATVIGSIRADIRNTNSKRFNEIVVSQWNEVPSCSGIKSA